MKQTDDKIEKFCKYCENAETLTDPDKMLCSRHGVVEASHICRKFRYDPLKRVPPKGLSEGELPVFEDDTQEKGTEIV